MTWTHVLVWRCGRPTVLTLHRDGRHEMAAREFADQNAAIAYFLSLVDAGRTKQGTG